MDAKKLEVAGNYVPAVYNFPEYRNSFNRMNVKIEKVPYKVTGIKEISGTYTRTGINEEVPEYLRKGGYISIVI